MESIIKAGGSGMIGDRLSQLLLNKGFNPVILSRRKRKNTDTLKFVIWDPETPTIADWPEGKKYVINLSGAGIADKRWTSSRKSEILSSRILSTRLLVNMIEKDKENIVGFLSASAIGYYGDGASKKLIEEMAPITKEFLSEVCVKWEQEALRASQFIENVCILRIGTVLADSGGALVEMDRTIPFGMANYLGDGQQYISWIHIDDLTEMILYCCNARLKGTYNAVAPNPRTNKEFMKCLRDVTNSRAVLLPAPAFAIKSIFGELSRLVLNSSYVMSTKITQSGFIFRYPNLKEALQEIYQKE